MTRERWTQDEIRIAMQQHIAYDHAALEIVVRATTGDEHEPEYRTKHMANALDVAVERMRRPHAGHARAVAAEAATLEAEAEGWRR